jgi:hypothetical protein
MPPQVPIWRGQSVPVWIQCQSVARHKFLLPYEVAVHFEVDGKQFTSFVNEKFVDQDNKRLAGAIIGDFNDNWLVDIPAETLISGPRLLVPKVDQGSVVVVVDAQ